MRWFYISVLVALQASCAWPDLARFDPADQRLDKKITLEVSDTKLDDVAKSLTELSGITVTAGTGLRDWKVREQHVTISAKDAPLSTVLDQLTKLHSFYLSREGKQGEWSYMIWQDKKSRDLEAEMLNAEKEAEAARAAKTRQATLDLAKKASELTPEEAKKLRDTDPNLAYLGGTKSGRAYSNLFNSLSQTDLDLMLRGRRVSIPFSSLSPALQQSAMDTTNSGIAALTGRNGADLTPLQVVISPLRDDVAGELVSMGVGGAIAVMGMPEGGLTGSNYDPILGSGDPMSIFLLSKPDSRFGKVFAEAMLDLEQGAPADEVMKTLNSVFGDEQSMAEAAAKDSPTETVPPTDPELTREVDLGKLTTGSGNASDALSANAVAVDAIAKATGFAVMLESFTKPTSIATYLKPGKQPFYKILIGLEKAGYEWKSESRTLRIRPNDWAVRRSWRIAESTIIYWRDRLEKQGCFSMDDLAAICFGLTDDQITRTLQYDPNVGYALSMRRDGADHERSMLRLYATLSPSQKATIATKVGLRFSDLSDKQWDYVAPVIMDRLGGVSITDGFITNCQQPQDETEQPDPWRFEVVVIGDDQQEHPFAVSISHLTKEELAPRIEARKHAREKAATKAAEKDAAPTK